MPDLPTPTHIAPDVWATYAAAHEQAEAARYAADVAAKAALDAAWLQITWGLPVAIFASIAALIAAGLTYRSAIKAAQHQTKLETERHQARVSAYAIRQKVLTNLFINSVNSKINFISDHAKIASFKYSYVETYNIMDYMIDPNDMPKEWEEEKWEEHAMLGIDYVKAIILIKFDYKQCVFSGDEFNEIFSKFNESNDVTIEKLISATDYYSKWLGELKNSLLMLKKSIPN
jgi:hypothetical protein